MFSRPVEIAESFVKVRPSTPTPACLVFIRDALSRLLSASYRSFSSVSCTLMLRLLFCTQHLGLYVFVRFFSVR